MRDMMGKLRLTVNENKTRVCSLPEEKFDFLGYTFGRVLLAADGESLSGHHAVQAARATRVCGD